jgi:chorismate mutase/prephenate dehydratase
VFESVVTRRARFGIIPIENNQEGIVSESIKLMSENDVRIVAEIPMPIHLAFASLEDRISQIRKIYSKDIAFRQCSNFLDDYFAQDVELIPVDSTSTAAKIASEERGTAAVCAHIGAKMYDLPVLFENIEDSSDNYTRFLIISHDFKNDRSGNDKTTILAQISADPGSLAVFLKEFHEVNINLTKIESYPAKKGKTFHYQFLLEFDGHVDDTDVKRIMDNHADTVKWLGSYPKLC